MAVEDLTSESEITILPDGRVFVFGATRPVLEILDSLTRNDERVQRLIQTLQKQDSELNDSLPAGVTHAVEDRQL